MAGKEPDGGPRIVAVGGGKGGTGKSLLAANLGMFLATLGRRVTLVDAAFGSANLHQLVGVPRPQRTLAELFGNTGASIEQVTVDTGISGVSLIAGEGDPASGANPKSAQINKLIARLRQLDTDFVIIDLGAGTHGLTLDLYLIANLGIAVTVPEPTSVELMFRFLRAAFVRRLRKVGMGDVVELGGDELRMYEGGIPAPSDILARARDIDAVLAERVAAEMHQFRPRLVVNLARSKADLSLCRELAHAMRRRFGVPAEALGTLEYDDVIAMCVRRRRPLLVEHPEARVARDIERAARRLSGRDATDSQPVAAGGDTYYDLLEVDPGATDEEIRRANRRTREVYGRDSLVVSALYNKARLDDLHLRMEQAYETLMDPVARKKYDQELFPGGIPNPPPAERRREESDRVITSADDQDTGEYPTVPPPPRPAAPELAPDTEFTGALMRQLRESLGIGLREISESTKIGMGYLTAIEDENFAKLPAVVYVRGFLVHYARALRIDEHRLLATYLERYKQSRDDRELEVE